MTTYKFTIPNRDSSIFRCDVYNDGSFMYHREVHMYDKNLTEEINTLVLAKKMGQTLDIDERDLYVPVRMAVMIGESTWTNSKY
jgi:hypothetical protein